MIEINSKHEQCQRNGVIRYGEGCRFNNNCSYPNCLMSVDDQNNSSVIKQVNNLNKQIIMSETTKRPLFEQVLYRDNKAIREDRGAIIVKGAASFYKRAIEDAEMEIENLKLEQSRLIDLNPSSKNSLDFANFSPSQFAQDDLRLCKDIYQKERWLEIFRARYNRLFVTPVEENSSISTE